MPKTIMHFLVNEVVNMLQVSERLAHDMTEQRRVLWVLFRCTLCFGLYVDVIYFRIGGPESRACTGVFFCEAPYGRLFAV